MYIISILFIVYQKSSLLLNKSKLLGARSYRDMTANEISTSSKLKSNYYQRMGCTK